MRNNFKRAIAGSVAICAAAAGSVLVPAAASAAPIAGSEGPVVLSPASGTTGNFFMTPNPVPANCPGDTASGGYTVQSFIAPLGTDITTLTFTGTGPSAPAFPLLSSTGSPVINQATAANTGQIVNQPAYSFSGFPANFFADGDYYLGYACTRNSIPEAWWTETITVTNPGNVFTYGPQVVAAPDAPVADTATPGNGSATLDFTAAATGGAADDFTVTADDGVGGVFTATGPASPITVTGLTNGTTYDISVVANNSGGTSPVSNVLQVTPEQVIQVSNLVASSGAAAGEIRLDWDAPAAAGLTGYTLTVTPTGAAAPVAGSPFTVGVVETFTVSGLESGEEYEFSIVPTSSDAGDVPVAQSVLRTVASAQVLQQVIQVERPEGALILTQRCGVNNGLSGEGSVAGFPGFPAVPSIPGTADQVGTSPDVDLVAPGVQDDPEFADYPFPSPATYPTRCIVDLGTAELITTGDLAGQYFAASGALDEVTVVDLRDVDAGWTINAAIPSLTEEDGDSFSGDLVGWTPQVTSTTDPVGTSTYDQIVTAGPSIVPGTAGGLSDGEVWASANAGEGLGVAVLDAYVKVLIPVSNDAGTYEGTLEITVS